VISRRSTIVLLLVGGAGVLLICSLQWVSATVSVLSGVGSRSFSATGSEVLSQSTPLSVVVIAGAFAVIAVRGWLRQGLGVLLAFIGLVLVISIVNFGLTRGIDAQGETLVDVQIRPWWPIAASFALLIVLAGAVCAGWSRSWPAMGTRYESDGVRRERALSPWDALDAGEDPTTMSDPDPGAEPA